MQKGRLHGLKDGRALFSMDKLKGSAAKTVIDKCEDFLNG